MAGDDDTHPGTDSVLGKLPRSRPGSRSGKRDAGAMARPRARRSAPPPPRAPEPDSPGNPVEAVARAATGAAGAGLRVASELTREAFRRLPRP